MFYHSMSVTNDITKQGRMQDFGKEGVTSQVSTQRGGGVPGAPALGPMLKSLHSGGPDPMGPPPRSATAITTTNAKTRIIHPYTVYLKDMDERRGCNEL